MVAVILIVKNAGHVLDIITLKNAPIIKGRRIRMSEDYEPICCSCMNCRRIVKVTRTRYDLECIANPNLGGVTRSYGKCRSYARQ